MALTIGSGGIAAGKSFQMLYMAKSENCRILCRDDKRRNEILSLAENLGIKGIKVITSKEYDEEIHVNNTKIIQENDKIS